MNKIDYLSNSSMERFSSCPLSYFHQYLNEEKPEQKNVIGFYADYGTLVHFLAEMYVRTNYFAGILQEKELTSKGINLILDVIHNSIAKDNHKLTAHDLTVIFEDVFQTIQFPDTKTKNTYYYQGLKFVTSFPSRDFSKVIALEQEFQIELPNLPIIKGFIDKVERDEKGIIITDYKTSKPYTVDAIKKKKQLPIYGMASWFLYGELPYKYRYDFVRYNEVVEVEISTEQLTLVKNQIALLYNNLKAFVKEEKFPAIYNKFYCKNFCGFSYLCPTYQKYEE